MPYKDPEVRKEKARQYYLASREVDKELKRKRYLANKDSVTENLRRRYNENPDIFLQRNLTWRLANKDKIKAYRAANKEHTKERMRNYQKANKEHLKKKQNELYNADKSKRREWYLKKKYGMTISDQDALFLRQCKSCAICKTTNAKRWDTDHCHASGQVRGILCHQCNVMLGSAKDNPDVLEAGIEYLRKFLVSENREAA